MNTYTNNKKLTAMNISYYDFQNLPDDIRYDMVINQGRFVEEKIIDNLKYSLYEVSFFSVEVIYNISSNKITGMNVFENRSAYFNG
ncbi:hypothetical protein DRF67_18030 [Chryseobacterium pennipullorum]|uniref:Uncharacterized protein n=2 Tax=Chryseobacterium pennipullorum TaxID=2258963 RepID=A0A3D9ATG8_9FLAO|nr:hypothetical protein DRF67_18030 [Chryseobacterium pennipullorum]